MKTGNRRKMGIVALCALALCVTALFAGCGSGGQTGSVGTLQGKLTMNGSTSMATVCQALGEVFHEQNPGVTVEKSGTGSGDAAKAVLAGTALIGDLSRELKESEEPEQFEVVQIATDGIAVVVQKDNPVTGLQKEQIAQIFAGEVTNWSQVGGQDRGITVLGREASSGTRDGFETIFGLAGKAEYAAELTSTGEVLNRVASDPAAIGYISLASVSPAVRALQVDGVAATEDNVKNGTYQIARPFLQIYRKGSDSELVQAWFAFVKSEQGKAVIEEVGLIPTV